MGQDISILQAERDEEEYQRLAKKYHEAREHEDESHHHTDIVVQDDNAKVISESIIPILEPDFDVKPTPPDTETQRIPSAQLNQPDDNGRSSPAAPDLTHNIPSPGGIPTTGIFTPPPSATVPTRLSAHEYNGWSPRHRPPPLLLPPPTPWSAGGREFSPGSFTGNRREGDGRTPLATPFRAANDTPTTPWSMDAHPQIGVYYRLRPKRRKRTFDSHYEMYPDLPYAAGLVSKSYEQRVALKKANWNPTWEEFPLKAYRRQSCTMVRINAKWDDEALLHELRCAYDRLRRPWRKWLSLRSVCSIARVWADEECIYPQHIGRTGLDPMKNMRMRYLLDHPYQMRKRYEFMAALTDDTDFGIEFVERFQVRRIAIAILLMIVPSLVTAIVYSVLTGDISSAFTIAGFMTSAYSVCLVLIGVVNLEEFY